MLIQWQGLIPKETTWEIDFIVGIEGFFFFCLDLWYYRQFNFLYKISYNSFSIACSTQYISHIDL